MPASIFSICRVSVCPSKCKVSYWNSGDCVVARSKSGFPRPYGKPTIKISDRRCPIHSGLCKSWCPERDLNPRPAA